MVLGLVSLAATVPLIATSTLTLQDSAQNQQVTSEENALRSEKCSIRVRASARMSDTRKQIVAGRHLTLVKNKVIHIRIVTLYMDDGSSQFHRFAGYFLPYPSQAFDGLVSTINDENMLNWIYIDPKTHEIKYGVREQAEQGLPGPMGLESKTAMAIENPGENFKAEIEDAKGIAVERRFTFNGWEGFALVEESQDVWALYFDKDDDGLKGKVEGKRVTEVELCRQPLALK